jgi:hypothetical protein
VGARRAHDEAGPSSEQLDARPDEAPDREATSHINTNLAPPVSAEASEDLPSDDSIGYASAGHDAEDGSPKPLP